MSETILGIQLDDIDEMSLKLTLNNDQQKYFAC